MNPTLLVVLAVLAAVMASTTAVFVRWAASCRSGLRAAIVVFLLLMMSGMLAGALAYELRPSPASAVVGLWLASVIMSGSVVIVFVAFVRTTPGSPGGAPAPRFEPGAAFLASVVGLVLLNEGLMGWTFGMAAGAIARAPAATATGAVALVGTIVVSPWFTFPMVIEMALTFLWLRANLVVETRRLLLTQPVAMFCSPPTLAGSLWVLGSAVGASGAMAVAIGYLLLLVHRGVALSRSAASYAGRLLLAFLLMAGGLAVWAVWGSKLLFAISIGAQMVVFLHGVLSPSRPAPPGRRPVAPDTRAMPSNAS